MTKSADIVISVNGEEIKVPNRTSVEKLLQTLQIGPGPVAVERNREVVPRAEHGSTILARGDALEVVTFVGGG